MYAFFLTQGQIDGNVVKAKFTLPPRQKVSPPPKPVSSAPKRDAPKSDNAGADVEKDGPKRPRESMSLFYILVILQFVLYNVSMIIINVCSFSSTENSTFSKKAFTST